MTNQDPNKAIEGNIKISLTEFEAVRLMLFLELAVKDVESKNIVLDFLQDADLTVSAKVYSQIAAQVDKMEIETLQKQKEAAELEYSNEVARQKKNN